MITELVLFANYKDNEAEAAALKIVGKVAGLIKMYKGRQVEDPTCVYWALDWETLQHHADFMDSEAYGPFKGLIGQFAQLQSMVHVPFEPLATLEKACGSPVTEIAIATLKPDGDRDEFEGIMQRIHVAIGGLPEAPPILHGITEENVNHYVLLCGWPTREAHYAAVGGEHFEELRNQCVPLVDWDIKHTALQQVA